MGLFSNLMFTLGLNNAPFNRSLDEAKKRVETTSKSMAGHFQSALGGDFFANLFTKALGGLGLGALAKLMKDAADTFRDRLKEVQIGMAQTDLDPETMQRLSNVTKYYGSSLEEAARGMAHLAEAQEKVVRGDAGSEGLLRSFHSLGLGLEDLRSQNFQDIFFQIARGMQGVDLSSERLAALKDIMGRGVVGLLPSMRAGFDGAIATSGLISDKDLKAAKEFKEYNQVSASLWADLATTAERWSYAIFSVVKSVPAFAIRTLFPGTFSERNYSAGRDRFVDPAMGQFRDKDAARKADEDAAEFQATAQRKLDEELAKKTAKQNEEIAGRVQKKQEEAKRAEMTPQQLVDYLQEESIKSRKRMNEDGGFMANWEQTVDLELDLARARKGLPKGAAQRGLHSDSLLSVGNFLGSSPDADTRRQLGEHTQLLRQVVAVLKEKGREVVLR